MKKGFKFNYVLKVKLENGKFISRNYMDAERATQAWLYYKNCTNAPCAAIFKGNDEIIYQFGL